MSRQPQVLRLLAIKGLEWIFAPTCPPVWIRHLAVVKDAEVQMWTG